MLDCRLASTLSNKNIQTDSQSTLHLISTFSYSYSTCFNGVSCVWAVWGNPDPGDASEENDRLTKKTTCSVTRPITATLTSSPICDKASGNDTPWWPVDYPFCLTVYFYILNIE